MGSLHWSVRPAVDVDRPRGAERDQHVLIHRQLVPPADPLLEVAGELPGEVLRHVVERLAPVAADQRRAHLAGDDREHGRHALVLRGGPEDGLAQPRGAGDGDPLGVDGRIGLAGSRSPG